jgi:hypothetical protein
MTKAKLHEGIAALDSFSAHYGVLSRMVHDSGAGWACLVYRRFHGQFGARHRRQLAAPAQQSSHFGMRSTHDLCLIGLNNRSQ